jgi:hypothetical protein
VDRAPGVEEGPAHPFYQLVNELLEEKRFDEFLEKERVRSYAEKQAPVVGAGNPSSSAAGGIFTRDRFRARDGRQRPLGSGAPEDGSQHAVGTALNQI